MRAADILLFCLCINAAVVFVDASGMGAMFTGHAGATTGYLTPEKGGTFGVGLADLNKLSTGQATYADMFLVSASWFVESSIFFLRFLWNAVFIIPAMMNIFGFPIYLAVFVQGLLYTTYVWAYVQWKSGKSLFSYQ